MKTLPLLITRIRTLLVTPGQTTYRSDRINEVLAAGSRHSLADMMRLQFDYLSIPARILIPYSK